MRISLSDRHLWWKETRQLLPLAVMIPVTALAANLLIMAFGVLFDPQMVATTRLTYVFAPIALSTPILYAIGVGGLLIGHEKETRTVHWLSGLPISPARLVMTKLTVGLVGLVILWCLCVVALLSVFGWSQPALEHREQVQHTLARVLSWFSYSAFLMMSGMALAWRLKSSWSSLFCLVPIAVAERIIAGVVSSGEWSVGAEYSAMGYALFLALLALVAGWISFREGRRALGPQSPAGRDWVSRSDYTTETQRFRRKSLVYEPPRRAIRPIPALLWQFTCQNRGMLVGILIVLTVSAGLMMRELFLSVSPHFSRSSDAVEAVRMLRPSPVAMLISFIAISWLGVLVFQSDTMAHRIRFLSDRGVASGWIWITRQAIPLAILSAFLLVLVIGVFAISGFGLQELMQLGAFVVVIAGVVLLAYLAAQWLGQAISSMILSAILAPVVGLAFIGFNALSYSALGTPVWLIALNNLISLAATRAMIRPWMDRALNWRYGLRHVGWLALYLLIPFMPLAVTFVRLPSMSATIAQEIENRHSIPPNKQELMELVLWDGKDAPTELPLQENQAAIIRDLTRQLESRPGPVSSASVRVTDFLATYARFSQLALRDSLDTQTNLENYRQAVALIAEISQRLRQSHRIIEQDLADYQEIWLLRELDREQGEAELGSELFESIANQLGSTTKRREARRQAIAASWMVFRADRFADHLGGYSLGSTQIGMGGRAWLTRQRLVSAAVADLWNLSANDSQDSNQLRMRIAQFWGASPEAYGIGLTGVALRADDLNRFTRTNVEGGGFLRTPASQWSAGWERQAEQLLRDIQSRNNVTQED